MKRVLRAFSSQDHREPLRDQVKCDDISTHCMINKNLIVGKYNLTVLEQIAEGGFALVHLVRSQSGQKYALKRMFVNNSQDLAVCEREIEIMKSLRDSKNVVRLVESSVSSAGDKVYEVLIMMELCENQLLNIMKDRMPKGFSEQEVMKIFCDVCKAVLAMHHCDPPIIHRDLKVENVLIDNYGRYLVCDFGSATWDFTTRAESTSYSDLPPPPPSRSSSLSSLSNSSGVPYANGCVKAIEKVAVSTPTHHKRPITKQINCSFHDTDLHKSSPSISSIKSSLDHKRRLAEPQTLAELEDHISKYTTPAYRAPELVDIYSNQCMIMTTGIDIWALGCLMYKLCFFVTPFGESALAIQNACFTIPDDSEYSTSLHRLIRYMLEPDINLRPSIDEVATLAHKISDQQDDELGRMVSGFRCPELETLKIPMTETIYRQSLEHRSNLSKFESPNRVSGDERGNQADSTMATGITTTSVAPIERPRGKLTQPTSLSSIHLPMPSLPSALEVVNSPVTKPDREYAVQSRNINSSTKFADSLRKGSSNQLSGQSDNEDLSFGREFDEIRRYHSREGEQHLCSEEVQFSKLVNEPDSEPELNPFSDPSPSQELPEVDIVRRFKVLLSTDPIGSASDLQDLIEDSDGTTYTT